MARAEPGAVHHGGDRAEPGRLQPGRLVVLTVCSDTGGYLAGILVVLTSGIALGSWLAAALLIVTSLPFLLYRAITEDRVLLAQLPGYREYAARVHWRLIPGLW